MDEPLAALDARTKLDMETEFLRIWENDADADGGRAKTVVFVTHDLQDAALLADRVVVMLPSPGRIAVDLRTELPRGHLEGRPHPRCRHPDRPRLPPPHPIVVLI
jgi:NitT/TauT family transport system ATP-binding protein